MATITPRKANSTITVSTGTKSKQMQGHKWWKAGSKNQLCNEVLSTASYLKQQQQYRYRQAAIYARLYGNMPLFNFAGSNMNKAGITGNLPIDRPTMNVVQSCVDTLVSRISQSRPRPVFLTDNGDYKQRNLAKQLNNFINGEFYQIKAHKLGVIMLRDAAVLGTGCLKVFETSDKRVGLERKLLTELLVDFNEAMYGECRQMYEMRLVDRDVLADYFPKYKSEIAKAEQAYPDNSDEATKTVSDQVMVVEAWRLPSGKDAKDGMHVIACSSGLILEEPWEKDKFPFVMLPYSERLLGVWGQGLSEQLMGTQVEINKLLMTISTSINLVGVPRVFVEDGSKVVKSHLNNQIGSIVTYRGTKPQYEIAPCVPAELYQQLQRLVDYSYQQSGISSLAAAAQKPAGLDSGAALREYDDIQSDRFAALSKRYDDMYVDLAYLVIDKAKDIAERDGKYQTVFPDKDGTKEVDLPMAKLLDDPFVIQCFDSSSLPRDPAGRLQKVTEMMQAGIIDPQEGRRLLDFPDIEQADKLANAGQERILSALDDIVNDGKYSPPDPFMDLGKAEILVTQYYNLHIPAKLEESRAEMLRNFFSQVQTLKQEAMQAMQPLQPTPQAAPMPAPQNPMIPNVPQ